MDKEREFKILEKELADINTRFLAFQIREKGQMLEVATKFESLVDWLDKEIALRKDIITVLHPAKSQDYTKGQYEVAVSCLGELAYMVLQRDILLSSDTTMEERACIERRICSVFNTHYNEELGYI